MSSVLTYLNENKRPQNWASFLLLYLDNPESLILADFPLYEDYTSHIFADAIAEDIKHGSVILELIEIILTSYSGAYQLTDSFYRNKSTQQTNAESFAAKIITSAGNSNKLQQLILQYTSTENRFKLALTVAANHNQLSFGWTPSKRETCNEILERVTQMHPKLGITKIYSISDPFTMDVYGYEDL